MALPSAISLVTMTGSLLDDAGNPLQGVVTLTPSVFQVVSPTTDTIIELQQRSIQLDQYGGFSVNLIPSDESDVLPGGTIWTLTLPGDTPASLQFVVPSDVPSGNIADYVVGSYVSNAPQFLMGYRGPQGDKGEKGDPGPAGYNDAPLVARVTALETAPFLRRVVHNGVSYPLRPSGVAAGLVEYVGPTQPVDWLTGDTWVQVV